MKRRYLNIVVIQNCKTPLFPLERGIIYVSFHKTEQLSVIKTRKFLRLLVASPSPTSKLKIYLKLRTPASVVKINFVLSKIHPKVRVIASMLKIYFKLRM